MIHAKLQGPLSLDKASQLLSTKKENGTMSKFLTPEEVMVRRKRNKALLYATVIIGTMVLSAVVTILTNQL
ncbi:Uncharacterised protein [Mycobacteroides abscessus subsp. abscessus]|nr:Uncharacterised protein [Mycobacteroides abscessus subsp. abscessus]